MVTGCLAGLGAVIMWTRTAESRGVAQASTKAVDVPGYSVVSSPVGTNGFAWQSVNDWNLWELELSDIALTD